MAKTLLDDVSETFTPPRQRWMPWRRKTLTGRLGERVSDVTEQAGQRVSDATGQVTQTAGDLASSLTENLTPSPTPRWLPWRRKTLADQVIEGVGSVSEQARGTTTDLAGQMSRRASDVASQMSQRASNVAGQVGQSSSALAGQSMPAVGGLPSRAAFQAGKLVGMLPGRSALSDSFVGSMGSSLPSSAGLMPGAPETTAERAAVAAEAAAQAAQRAVGLMERVGGWVGLLASRVPQQEQVLPLTAASPAAERAVSARGAAAVVAPAVEVSREDTGAGGMTNRLRQVALNVGERINDWSDGRYGLEPQKLDKKGKSALKKSDKQRERLAEKAAKESAKRSGASWLPWMIGLSIGLVAGLVGVAYWQRRRLQSLWGETSQRARQATDSVRQRIEASRSTIPQTIQQDVPPTTPNFTPLGSATPVTDVDQPSNGRLESASQ